MYLAVDVCEGTEARDRDLHCRALTLMPRPAPLGEHGLQRVVDLLGARELGDLGSDRSCLLGEGWLGH